MILFLKRGSEFYLKFLTGDFVRFFGKLDSVFSVLLIPGFNTENKSVILHLLHRFQSCFFSSSSLALKSFVISAGVRQWRILTLDCEETQFDDEDSMQNL